ncbi:MAG: diguanylate cyclase [Pseudobdellovibrionaceae bacterium]
MKKWMQKLVEQINWSKSEPGYQTPSDFSPPSTQLSEEMATLLFVMDVYSKHIFDMDQHPVRKSRDVFDTFARNLLEGNEAQQEKILFRFRQHFERYRIDEFSHVQKTFDDFRTIIWEFVDQLADELGDQEQSDYQIQQKLEQLKDAVEANSIVDLKNQARLFIDSYVEYQTRRDEKKTKRLESFKSNLDKVKRQLVDVSQKAQEDHLTKAANRKAFDEKVKQVSHMVGLYGKQATMLALDIDFFKKINDTYGHAVGDFILIEFVKILKSHFNRDMDFVARIGGEEFVVILPDFNIGHAVKKTEELLKKIRLEKFIQDGETISFTASVGIAQLLPHETPEKWLKRADEALYEAKKTGRDKYTLAPHIHESVA